MIAGDKTRRVQACAFDGCTAALPGQGHGKEPRLGLYRPATQLSAPIVKALAVNGRARVLLLEGRKPNLPDWWDHAVARLALRTVDLTEPTLRIAPRVVGCAAPGSSTFGLKHSRVLGFEFAGGVLLLKLPCLSESGSTQSPCFSRCPRRALMNSHEIAFAQFFAESLLTLAEGPPRTLREHGVVQLTEHYWRLGDGDVVFENAEGYVDRRGAPVGSAGPIGYANGGMSREVEMSLKCPNGHIFWHERANYNHSKTTSATATTIQVGISKKARKRIDGDSYVFCEKCKLGSSNWGGS